MLLMLSLRLLYRIVAVSRMCSLNSSTDTIPTMMESRIAKGFIREGRATFAFYIASREKKVRMRVSDDGGRRISKNILIPHRSGASYLCSRRWEAALDQSSAVE